MSTKKCTKCLQDLELSNFTSKPKKGGQYLAACKKCTYDLYYRPSSIKRLGKQGKVPRKVLDDTQRKESEKNSRARYFQSKKGKAAKKRSRIKEGTKPENKVMKAVRRRLEKALKGNKKIGKTVEFIGCTSAELRQHIESQFLDGMSWENYGEWHIDHIRPMCSFVLTKEEDLKQVNHFSNLRPLWAVDNLAKALDGIKLKMTASKELTNKSSG